jgi:hypothetical protein
LLINYTTKVLKRFNTSKDSIENFQLLENNKTIKGRLELFINHLGISKNTFTKAVGLGQGGFSKIVRGNEGFGVNKLLNILNTYPELNERWLLFGEGEMINSPESIEKKKQPLTPFTETSARPVLVTVDSHMRENISLVPIKAQAGYLVGYHDPQFIQELPSFALPGFRNDIYRAFEVEGHSMLQFEGAGLYPTDIVIASYVENASDIRDNRVYVIISESEGVIIKRCINRLNAENGVLICNSDNSNGNYPPITLRPEQIKEVWAFRAKISRQIPRSTGLADDITELKAQFAMLSQRMNEIEMLTGRQLGE